MSYPAVFLDRDGTLMENVGYCHRAADVAVFPGVPAALARLREGGFRLVIVTNQSGIGRGYFPEADYHAVHAELLRQLGPGLIDADYFCPDKPETPSARRKPAPGMLLEAAADHSLDLARSYLVGDHAADIECARAGGLAGAALVMTGHGPTQTGLCRPAFTAADFAAAADWILQATGRFTPAAARGKVSG